MESPEKIKGKFLLPESPAKVRKVEASPRKGMTELSPRRVPRSPLRPPVTPPNWKRPDEVMRLHRLKKNSLTSRFNKCDNTLNNINSNKQPFTCTNNKRKNPFRVDNGESNIMHQNAKKTKEDNERQSESITDSSSLFRLLGLTDPQAHHKDPLNFESIIEKIKQQNQPQKKSSIGGRSVLPVDWSLRSKVRFMSSKPFPWTQTLKASEEASGITGYVRRIGEESIGLDTSPSCVFHQCCLYWQYPSIPWLTLYPRRTQDNMTGARKQQVDKSLPSFATHPLIKESLLNDFTESFRSVFQLLRARHCPYFYLVSPSFTCLFRSSGINNSCEISAMVCPTTQGFRQLLRDNDIEFSLPLRQKETKRRSGGVSGENTLSNDTSNDKIKPSSLENSNSLSKGSNNSNNTSGHEHNQNGDQQSGNKSGHISQSDEEEDDIEDEGETREWLTKLGLPTKHLDRLDNSNNDSSIISDVELDGSDESLVYVEGTDVSLLYNFLINFKSISVSTGPSANIPPTILSPVAFTRSTLTALQVRESVVKADKDSYHSVEICGPILPDTIHNICDILDTYLDEFSVTFATDLYTKPFSFAVISRGKDKNNENKNEIQPASAFSIENLRDCGMKSTLLSRFCSQDVQLIDSIKFCNRLYNIE